MLVTNVSAAWELTLPAVGSPHKPNPNTPARSQGVHVSDLVRAAAVDAGLFTPDDVDAGLQTQPPICTGGTGAVNPTNPAPIFSQPAINRMCAGLAWEEWLAVRYAGRLQFHPGEITIDGVAGSPDAWGWDDPATRTVPAIHEFKFTWKSSNTPPHKNWYWISQIQCYLLACRWTVGYLHTYHVMGDYRQSGPLYRVMKLEFSQTELLENWALLQRYRTRL